MSRRRYGLRSGLLASVSQSLETITTEGLAASILPVFPSMSDANDATYLKLGTCFSLGYGSARNAQIVGIRFYRPSGATDTCRAYLYGNDGTELVDEEISSYTAGGVSTHLFASPVDYDTADAVWMVAFATPDGLYGYDTQRFSGAEDTLGPITLPEDGTFTFNSTTGRNGQYATSDVVPNLNNQQTFHGVVPIVKYDLPTADNTGVPTDTELTPSSGTMTISTNDQTIDALDHSGNIVINSGVTGTVIQNSHIDGSAYHVIQNNSATPVVVTDCEIEGGQNGILGPCTVTRCNIHDVENGIQGGPNVTAVDNYIHGLTQYAGETPHYDGIDMQGDNTIAFHNVVDVREYGQTSCMYTGAYAGNADNVQVLYNLCLGAGYTLYFTKGESYTLTNAIAVGNVLKAGAFGYAAIYTDSGEIDLDEGNTDYDTGDPISL